MTAMLAAAVVATATLVTLAIGRRVGFVALLIGIALTQNIAVMAALRWGLATLDQARSLIAVKDVLLIVSLGALVVIAVGRLAVRGRFRPSRPVAWSLAMCLLLALALAIPGNSLGVRLAGARAIAILPALFLLGYFLNVPRRSLAAATGLVGWIGVVLAVFGLVEAFVLPADFWLRVGHEEYYLMKRGRPIQGTLFANMRFWIDGTPIRRVASLTGDPLISSYPMSLALVLLAAPALLTSRVRLRSLFTGILLAMAILLTFSRGAVLSVLTAAALLVVTRWRTRWFQVLSLVGFAFAIAFTVLAGEWMLRYTTGAGHVDQLREGLLRGLERPVGYGLGVASSVATGFARATGEGGAILGGGDSYVGSIATQIGVVGLLAFAVTAFSIAFFLHARGAALARVDRPLGLVSVTVAAFLVALIVTSTVNESGMGFVASGLTFMLAGVFTRMVDVRSATSGGAGQVGPERPPKRDASLSGAADPAAPHRPIYLVWKGYQRRAEALAPVLGGDLVYMPHRFRARTLRPLDYAEKFVRTLALLRRRRPAFVVVQAPPVFVALPARLLGVAYAIDAHNATFQEKWDRLPGSGWLLRGARAVLAHNDEIAAVARSRLPGAHVATLRDPLAPFDVPALSRERSTILVIASFGADEPIDVLVETAARAPDLTFLVTADPRRLPAELSARLHGLSNVRLTGFLPTSDYHRTLLSAGAALVLTTRPGTQPSGACEALTSDTPLVLSRTDLTEAMFGTWAYLVDHDPAEIVAALRACSGRPLDLASERARWDAAFESELALVEERFDAV